MSAEEINNRYREHFEQFIVPVADTKEQQEHRMPVCTTAQEVQRRLRGFVPLNGWHGLPTHTDNETNTLHVFTDNHHNTYERVMNAIWNKAPNCSGVRVIVHYCGKAKEKMRALAQSDDADVVSEH